MPISLNSTGGANSGAAGNFLSWTHAVSASSCILVVSAACYQQTFGAVTQIRYGSSASGSTFTQRAIRVHASTITHEIWTLLNPTTGSTTIHVEFNNGSLSRLGISAAFSGVDTTSPIVSTLVSTGTGTGMSTEHVSGSSDVIVNSITIDAGFADSSVLAGSSQTEISHSTRSGIALSMSYKMASGTSAQTSMAWTWNDSAIFGYCGLVLADQAPGGSTVPGGVLMWAI